MFIALGMLSHPFIPKLASLRVVTRKPKNKRQRLGMLSQSTSPNNEIPEKRMGLFRVEGTHWRVRVGTRKGTVWAPVCLCTRLAVIKAKGKLHSD